jgi:nucleotide-binding universal stress UspA family protein
MKIKPSTKLEKLMRDVRARTEPRAAAALFAAARKRPAARLKKILVPTDFSDLSMAAVRAAIPLAHKLGAAVALVHVVKPSPHFTGTEAALLVRNDLEVLEWAERDLSRIARTQSKKNLIVNSFVRYGQPFNEIATLARTHNADLIVIATHGHTGFERLVLAAPPNVSSAIPLPCPHDPGTLPRPPPWQSSNFRAAKNCRPH